MKTKKKIYFIFYCTIILSYKVYKSLVIIFSFFLFATVSDALRLYSGQSLTASFAPSFPFCLQTSIPKRARRPQVVCSWICNVCAWHTYAIAENNRASWGGTPAASFLSQIPFYTHSLSKSSWLVGGDDCTCALKRYEVALGQDRATVAYGFFRVTYAGTITKLN